MAARLKAPVTPLAATGHEQKDMVKHLDHAEALAHQGIHRTFEAWLDATEQAIGEWRLACFDLWVHTEDDKREALRRGFSTAVWNGEDGPLKDYHPEVREHMRQAYVALCLHAVDDDDASFEDILGSTYMELGHSNSYMGQYFTPWSAAKMMAMMTLGNTAQWGTTYTYEKPCTICDPCVGSGVLLLAAASCIPKEAILRGEVMFYGQDLDNICVKMARLNLRIRGLNSRLPQTCGVKDIAQLTDAEVLQMGPAILADSINQEARIANAAPEVAVVMSGTLASVETRLAQLGLDFGEGAVDRIIAPRRKRGRA